MDARHLSIRRYLLSPEKNLLELALSTIWAIVFPLAFHGGILVGGCK